MAKKILMNDINKLKITLVREDRVNFRYDGVLYSIQNNRWDGDGGIDFKKNVNGKFEYVNFLENDSLRVCFLCCMKNGLFKNNYIYSHISKEYFLRELSNYGFIDADEMLSLAELEKDLARNEAYKEFLKEEFEKNTKATEEKNRSILSKIKKLKEKLY